VGIEPACESDGTNGGACDSVNREKGRGAPAPHFVRSNWLDLSSVDADLLSVVLAWEKISGPIRKAIIALVESSEQ
jgi:hypothetical protein